MDLVVRLFSKLQVSMLSINLKPQHQSTFFLFVQMSVWRWPSRWPMTSSSCPWWFCCWFWWFYWFSVGPLNTAETGKNLKLPLMQNSMFFFTFRWLQIFLCVMFVPCLSVLSVLMFWNVILFIKTSSDSFSTVQIGTCELWFRVFELSLWVLNPQKPHSAADLSRTTHSHPDHQNWTRPGQPAAGPPAGPSPPPGGKWSRTQRGTWRATWRRTWIWLWIRGFSSSFSLLQQR